MTKQEALRLRGRLEFTFGNVFGRVAICSLAAISNHAYSSRGSSLSGDAILARSLLSGGRPRELKPSSAEPWFIQTDACYDVGVTVLRQVLAQCSSLQWGNQFFSFHRSCLMRMCQYSIPQANRRRFSNKNSLHYFALSCFGVTGLRMQLLSALIATVFVTSLEMKLQRKSSARQWHLSALNTSHLGTQETDSNLSGGPSRFSCQKFLDMGAEECKLDLQPAGMSSCTL